MSSVIREVWDLVITALQDAGLQVVNDSRAVRPPCIIVEPPAVTGMPNAFTLTHSVNVYAVAPPPGNRDSAVWLMETADAILQALTGYGFQAAPTHYQVGEQDLPAYQISFDIQARRQ